jgi:hypothetical protein
MSRIDYESFLGKRFGKLVVEKIVLLDKTRYFLCDCDCGNTKLIDARNVLRGLSTSCGCNRAVDSARRAITDRQVKKIIQLRAGGLSYRQIATRLDLSRTTVCNYCKDNENEICKAREDALKSLEDF